MKKLEKTPQSDEKTLKSPRIGEFFTLLEKQKTNTGLLNNKSVQNRNPWVVFFTRRSQQITILYTDTSASSLSFLKHVIMISNYQLDRWFLNVARFFFSNLSAACTWHIHTRSGNSESVSDCCG